MGAFGRVICHYILILKKCVHVGITLPEIYLKRNVKDVYKNLTRMFTTIFIIEKLEMIWKFVRGLINLKNSFHTMEYLLVVQNNVVALASVARLVEVSSCKLKGRLFDSQ